MAPATVDLKAGSALAVGLGLLLYFLWQYVGALAHPLPMLSGFGVLLVLACYYELRDGIRRHTVALATVQVWLFAFASMVAPIIRNVLIDTLRAMADTPELITMSGPEYAAAVHSALHNPVLGYSGCFALSLALFRLCFTGAVKLILFGWSLEHSDLPQPCPHCGR